MDRVNDASQTAGKRTDAMTTDESDSNDNQLVRYRLLDDSFDPPPAHDPVDDDEYVAPFEARLEHLDQAEMIEVLDWDWEEKEGEFYDAPPELITDPEDGHLAVAYPTRDLRTVQTHGLHEYRCQRCEMIEKGMPVFPEIEGDLDGPAECSGCERQGPFMTRCPEWISRRELQQAVTANPVWTPPSGVEEATPGQVWDDLRDYIYRHWDAGDREWLYDGLTAYVMSTWFRERFEFVPHLLVYGPHETGKTRVFNCLERLCYRALHTIEPSEASIYRGVDRYSISFFVSEYHDLNDEKQEQVDAVLKSGQKRGEKIPRMDQNAAGDLDLVAFDAFTHVGISTQIEPRDDIVSRCFRIETAKATRPIPRKLAPADDLRNSLLYLRFRYLRSDEFDAAEARAERYMDDNNLFNRISEKLWSLLSTAELCNRDLSNFIRAAIERSREEKADTEEALFVRACIDEAFEQLTEMDAGEERPWANLLLKTENVAERFNALTDRDVSTRYMGMLRNRVGLDKTRRSDGSYISDDDLRAKLKELADTYNVDWEPTAGVLPEMVENESLTDSEPAKRKPTDQDSEVNTIMEIVEQEARATDGDPAAPRERVIERAESAGIPEEKAEHRIEKLKQKGELISPEGDRIARIEDW